PCVSKDVLQITLLLLLSIYRQHAMPHPPPQRILWIGAHPDDEGLVAPLLGRSCIDETDRCSLLLMTRAEGDADPAVRAGQMRRAADLFRAHLDLWDFGDV